MDDEEEETEIGSHLASARILRIWKIKNESLQSMLDSSDLKWSWVWKRVLLHLGANKLRDITANE